MVQSVLFWTESRPPLSANFLSRREFSKNVSGDAIFILVKHDFLTVVGRNFRISRDTFREKRPSAVMVTEFFSARD